MFKNVYARRAVATTATLTALLLGQGLAVANAVEESNVVHKVMVWDGEGAATQEFDLDLFGGINFLVPGDSGERTLRVSNALGNPSDGLVTVSIVDVELRDDEAAGGVFEQHITVNGYPLAELAAEDREIFSGSLERGDDFVDVPFDWQFTPLTEGTTPGNLPEADLGVDLTVRVEISGETPETLLTVFTTTRGPVGTLAAEFEADRLALADEFGGVLYAVTEAGVEELSAFTGDESSVHAAIPVAPDTPHVATAFFNNPDFSDDLAAAYAVVQPGGAVPGFPADLMADVGQLQCFLADESGAPLPDQGVEGWNPSTGATGYIEVPEGQHAVCEIVAETALLSVRKIVQDLLVADGVFTLDDEGLPVHTPGDADLTANWTVRITSDDLSHRNDDGTYSPMEFPFMLPTRGRNWEAEGGVPEFIKVRPGASYTVEILAPYNAALAEFFEPVEVYLQRSNGTPVTDSANHLAAIAAARADGSDSVAPQAEVAGAALRLATAWTPPSGAAGVGVNRAVAAGGVIAAIHNLVPAPLEVIEITAISHAPRRVETVDGPTIEVEAEEVVEIPVEVTATATVTQTAQPPAGGTNRPTNRPNVSDPGTSQAPGSPLTRTGANTLLLTLGVLAIGLGLVVIAKRRSDENGAATHVNGDLG